MTRLEAKGLEQEVHRRVEHPAEGSRVHCRIKALPAVPGRKTAQNESIPDGASQQTNGVDINVQTLEEVLVVTGRSNSNN